MKSDILKVFLIAALTVGLMFTIVHAETTYEWSCMQGDGAETGFKTKAAVDIAAKAHRDAHPGHKTVVAESKTAIPANLKYDIKINKKDWESLTKEQQEKIISNLKRSGLMKEGVKIVPDPQVKSEVQEVEIPTGVAATGREMASANLGKALCKIACNTAEAALIAVCVPLSRTAAAACIAVAQAAGEECRKGCD